MSSSGYIHIEDVNIVRETDYAFLIQGHIEDDPHHQDWIPKSQIADADNYKEGDRGVNLSITEWIAKEKGLQP